MTEVPDITLQRRHERRPAGQAGAGLVPCVTDGSMGGIGETGHQPTSTHD